MVLLELVLVLVLLQAWVLVLWIQVRMLEALSRMLAQLLVLALVALVLVLLAELLAQVLMLLWGRTFVLFWVLAQLMLTAHWCASAARCQRCLGKSRRLRTWIRPGGR